ncbi:glutamine synthetase/guanido kinase [Lentinus tigrinus ALCF2SS1-7]|uniref:Glutamine synthetase n=1 Tax=Lentinus tigrinus ALCF2SS1-6 TaxID=1328759 RepID=A0A5C2SP03_9APHY|nr:glutamine synthetase/guanido kinase [Lentinus tigrinus ALCF2SS1-6]RPD79240.1 glutamine synthetase/guanido kinase [Lentinus tigrinus ALCF2SS1-7]
MSSGTYGALYSAPSPSTAAAAAAKPPALDSLLTPAIKFVRVQWIDFINTPRVRVLSAAYFRKLYEHPGTRVGLGIPHVGLGIVGLNVADGFGAVGEWLYVPDLSSWRVCTYAPGHAVVMGWFQEKTPAPGKGLEVPLCPRTLLHRLVTEAQDKAGVSFLVGVEHEFMLLSQTTPEPVYVNNADWSCAAKFRTGSIENTVLEEISNCLLDAGIELQQYHAEAAPGQYEIVTGPLPPLQAADAVVFTRETIYNIASKHGLKATFTPRLHADSCGNGAHVHISVHGGKTETRKADEDRAPRMSPTERSFLQGILTHLPAVVAFTLPTAASYARMIDGIWAGGTTACWGTYNKEAPVRVCGPAGHSHFEVKSSDATATPHLAFAGIVAAGLRGILDGALLTTGDCHKPAHVMSEAERKAVGLDKALKLPKTIAEARDALDSDAGVKDLLGAEFVESYLNVNKLMERWITGKDEQATVRKYIEYF